MAENSKIEWTDHTFNPWIGCTKVSPACKNCYAERDFDHRYGKAKWGPNGTRVITSDTNWKKPLAWDRQAAADGVRPRVFCASLADVFEDWQGPIFDSKGDRLFWSHSREPYQSRWHWIAEPQCAGGEQPVTMDFIRQRLFELIDATPNLDWLLLTKRPENIERMWPRMKMSSKTWDSRVKGPADHRRNLWLGTSVENQEWTEKRIPELLKCRDLSPVLFLSCEPLVGPVDLRSVANACVNCDDIAGCDCDCPPLAIDWVITGGESGPDARPCDPEWFRSLRDQSAAAGVPFHFKQWGEFDEHQVRVGKKNAGRLLDGRTHDGFPVGSLSF
jgi:protein gp37